MRGLRRPLNWQSQIEPPPLARIARWGIFIKSGYDIKMNLVIGVNYAIGIPLPLIRQVYQIIFENPNLLRLIKEKRL
jgi:hypothetical protein